MIKVGDYVRYKLAGYYPQRAGTVLGLRRPLESSGHQAEVQWSDELKPRGAVWEWCDHLKVIATTETKCQ
jgi:hypothetical protein